MKMSRVRMVAHIDRQRRRLVALLCVLIVACGGGDPRIVPDSDGDGIDDVTEGRSDPGGPLDSDGDGTPDYLDLDSDDDTLPDEEEHPGGPLLDADGDGLPDVRDRDADDNGLPDGDEPTGDLDGDGTPDFRDADDDGDGLWDRDEWGEPGPVDTDDDGTPDYRDPDSDDDTILDRDEGDADTDGNGVPDRRQLDADNDRYLDADEAGDANPATRPVDTDDDGTPDFQDPDSDGDGLSDLREKELGTNRIDADSDDDGVTDLVEVEACDEAACAGEVLDGDVSPRTRGSLVFLVPFGSAASPESEQFAFSSELTKADVYFLIDTTSTMDAAIASVRDSLAAPDGLIARAREDIQEVWFGVGAFDDYPVTPYGNAMYGGRAFYHLADVSASADAAQTAVNGLTTHAGGDLPESLIPALHAVATGEGLGASSGWRDARVDSGQGFSPCPSGRHGWPCFRPDALPIIVAITDQEPHNGPGGFAAYDNGVLGADAPTYAEARDALLGLRARVVGVAVGGGGKQTLDILATDTGAFNFAGERLVSVTDGAGVADSLISQLSTLANQAPVDVSLTLRDAPGDGVDARTLIERLSVFTGDTLDDGSPCTPGTAEDRSGDGHPETFVNVAPGMPVCFEVRARNRAVPPTGKAQLIKATLEVLGDGFTPLDAREIYFLIPPDITVPVVL